MADRARRHRVVSTDTSVLISHDKANDALA